MAKETIIVTTLDEYVDAMARNYLKLLEGSILAGVPAMTALAQEMNMVGRRMEEFVKMQLAEGDGA